MMGFGFGMGVWGLLVMILFWVGLVALVVWLVGLLFPTARKPDPDTAKPSTAQDILDARYARGELTDEQYQHMAHTIQH